MSQGTTPLLEADSSSTTGGGSSTTTTGPPALAGDASAKAQSKIAGSGFMPASRNIPALMIALRRQNLQILVLRAQKWPGVSRFSTSFDRTPAFQYRFVPLRPENQSITR
ncbi:hypothetical protein [Tabrizicola sp.]|uniref:hypothetical protein n=1 Tax=Tabrizicola sp. TaxID=2005166 RepID=UPI003F2CD641